MNWKNTTSSPTFQQTSACCCIGPQNGEPLCPCAMRNVKIVDGRYVRTEDLGPAPGNPTGYETCLFDQCHDPNNPLKPMHLACPCPKCALR